MTATWSEFVLDNRLTQERVTLLRSVPLEGRALSHFVGGGMQRLHANGWKRLRHIADSETNHGLRRIGSNERVHAFRDIREEIGGFELGVVFVDADHGG